MRGPKPSSGGAPVISQFLVASKHACGVTAGVQWVSLACAGQGMGSVTAPWLTQLSICLSTVTSALFCGSVA